MFHALDSLNVQVLTDLLFYFEDIGNLITHIF